MGPETMMISIINWGLGLLALILVLMIMVCPLATIIAAIVEGTKQLSAGERRSWKKTVLFAILSVVGLFGLIAILALWGVAVYLVG